MFSTYFGGTRSDNANGVAVDGDGNVYIAGQTTSADMGVKNAYQATLHGTVNAFIAKFSPTGTLWYSTYLGGAGNGDSANAIAVDASGRMYVTGVTRSTAFPTSVPYHPMAAGGNEVFVTVLSAAGSALVFSTYLGGSGDDYANSIAVGPAGSVYVSGFTTSVDFPTANAYQTGNGKSLGTQAFVTRFALPVRA